MESLIRLIKQRSVLGYLEASCLKLVDYLFAYRPSLARLFHLYHLALSTVISNPGSILSQLNLGLESVQTWSYIFSSANYGQYYFPLRLDINLRI